MCRTSHVSYVLLLVAQSVHMSTQCSIGYTGPNASLWCTCNAGYTGRNFIAPHSTRACARFVALMTWKTSFASVSTRLSAGVGSTILPTYNPSGGPKGKGHVSFRRINSQFLDAGVRTLNVNTNGGYTVVAVVRFMENSWNQQEHIVFHPTGVLTGTASSLNGYLARLLNTNQIVFNIRNAGTSLATVSSPAVIVQNSLWITIVATYVASTKTASLSVNGVVTTRISTFAWTDKNVVACYIGRSTNGVHFLNADVAGVFVVDEFLTTAATTAIADAMHNGVDLTDTTCPSGTVCTACGAGNYKSSPGTAVCTTCPAGLTAPMGSTSSAACSSPACNAGYTGPNGICSTCAAGTYKNTTGSAPCTHCRAASYSPTVAATTATTCLACPANSNSPSMSSAAMACKCNAGYTGPDGGPCTACIAGSYKTTTGSTACTSCPTFSGSICAICGTSVNCMCTGYTDSVCTACVSASAPASTRADACVCGPGMYDAGV
jgi:hypothetical protein